MDAVHKEVHFLAKVRCWMDMEGKSVDGVLRECPRQNAGKEEYPS